MSLLIPVATYVLASVPENAFPAKLARGNNHVRRDNSRQSEDGGQTLKKREKSMFFGSFQEQQEPCDGCHARTVPADLQELRASGDPDRELTSDAGVLLRREALDFTALMENLARFVEHSLIPRSVLPLLRPIVAMIAGLRQVEATVHWHSPGAC